ncbi:DEAD/DEAH box helicase [Bacillus sp. REN3]|uniref:DEAD/DEAH box helicase n=1 Tax=Bacillus sp. REN3 TaxID=2802440 RepID=UPI001AEEF760|nr:DEAD/DEAH box helicase [Bacillus sp. REN3]
MEIELNHKKIKELCGPVSYKKGQAFCHGGKVRHVKDNENQVAAIVTGTEAFEVIVKKEADGQFKTKCSCPVLASVEYECQHVAAVLLSILDQQQAMNEGSDNPSTMTNHLLTIFDSKQQWPSGSQLYFETRRVLQTQFKIKPFDIGEGYKLFGTSINISAETVLDLSGFLYDVHAGQKSMFSQRFQYDPEKHCFDHGTNLVITKLIEMVADGKQGMSEDGAWILIPPSYWEQLLPLLKNTRVMLEYNGHSIDGMGDTKKELPLRFTIQEAENGSGYLSIDGMDQILIMKPYGSVLSNGKLIKLQTEDCDRLFELRKLLDASRTNHILIGKEQAGVFMEKVIPGLRKIGEVKVEGDFRQRFKRTPLVARLYLDRVKNRLLAGLEFHYGNIMLNPLENMEFPSGTMVLRDVDKEEMILELMEESSFARTESGYFLQNDELEYEFLYHMVPKLEKFVRIYATTAVRNRIFKAPAPPRINVKVKKERTNWLEFKFQIEGIPEQQIRELLEALEEKRKYFRLRSGSLMSLETREFEEIQRFLKTGPIQAEDLEKGLNVPLVRGMGFIEASEDQGIFMPEESFRQFLDEINSPGSFEYEVPQNLANILRDYQVQGYQWMKKLASYGFGGVLADDMGLGKTLQSIAFISSELPVIRKMQLPVLIVCPSSLTYNWLGEFMKFTPEIQAAIADGQKSERKGILDGAKNFDVIITSYTLLRQDIQLYEKLPFHTVFFDEAQAFKNPLTQTAKAVIKLQAKNRFALTGTPIENAIEELWSIYRGVFPELFQGLKEYSQLSRKTISRRIRPFMLRRVKEDVLEELPGKMESIHVSELLPEQKKLYAAYLAKLRHETLKHLDKETIRKNRIKILAGLTRLRQICCHPALFVEGYKGSSAKFEQLLKIVDESKQTGRRVLIFSQFTKMLNLIGRELAFRGIPYFYLDGQTPPEERVTACARYNAGERDFFLISLKAGGSGLNLAGADTVILYDLWWNPAVEEQASDRAHRMGQKSTVQVIKLLSSGTIEEKMNDLQEKKRGMIEEIIEERNSAILTEDDIREILMI